MVHLEMRIDVLKRPCHRDLRQRFRPHLNVKALRPLDLLPRNLDRGVLLERREDGIVESETRRLRTHPHAGIRSGEESIESNERDEDQDRVGKFSHGKRAEKKDVG